MDMHKLSESEKELAILITDLLPEDDDKVNFMINLLAMLGMQTSYLHFCMKQGATFPETVKRSVEFSISNMHALAECDPLKIRYMSPTLFKLSRYTKKFN